MTVENNTVKINKAVKEMTVITPLVKEIQAGNTDKWTDLFNELKRHRASRVRKFKEDLKGFATLADVEARYDDLLMDAVNRFDSDLIDNFVRYFNGVLKTSMYQLSRDANAKKRVLNYTSVYGDEPVSSANSDSNMTIFDNIENPINQYEVVETGISLHSILSEYSEQSEKTKLNADLIVAAALTEEGTEERKAMMLKLLPEGTSWATARQKLSRARADLKGFIVESSF